MFIIKVNGRGGVGYVRSDRGDLFLTIDREKATVYQTELDAKVDVCQVENEEGQYELTIEKK